MKYEIGDTLVLDVGGVYVEYVIKEIFPETLQVRYKGKEHIVLLDREQIEKRMGTSWTHKPKHIRVIILDEDLFIL